MIQRLMCLAALLLLAGCQKAAAPAGAASHPGSAGRPPGIAWFDGTVEQAFEAAREQHRPVFLYWGAQWCPFCHTLKATVFSRADFIAKSKLFLPVYLDGDDEGAQRWGDAFHIQGYPTVIILDAEKREIMRLGAGRDVSQYAALLDVALEDVQPTETLLRKAGAGTLLSAEECRRLAYDSWELTSLDASSDAAQAAALDAAAKRCPESARLERASLRIYAAFYAANAAAAGPSPLLPALQDAVRGVLAAPDLASSTAAALATLDVTFFHSVRARGGAFPAEFRDAYVAAMDAASRDPRYALADQLEFIDAQLRALKGLDAPDAPIPAQVATTAHARIDAALSKEQSPYVRAGLVNASLGILEDLGDLNAAYAIAKAEIPRALAPYYYKADLGEIAEQLGHREEALRLLDEAYRESQGTATRFQWGQIYLTGLLRMAPDDSSRIAQAGTDVLGELDGPDRIYRRARFRLEKLDRALRAWNETAHGAHADVLRALHARMQQICVRIDRADEARASCDAFLNPA